MSRAHVLSALARIANVRGQTSISMAELARRSRGDIKTVRRAVHHLHEQGTWLRIEPMTWGELVQALPGWRMPEHADPDGTATYLFTLLDGYGQPAAETFGQGGPGLRATRPQRPPRPGPRHTSPGRSPRPEARAELPELAGSAPAPALAPEPAPDTAAPIEAGNQAVSRTPLPTTSGCEGWLPRSGDKQTPPPDLVKETERADGAPEGRSTHISVSSSPEEGGESWREAWEAIVSAHRKHFARVYGVAPRSPRGLKRSDPSEAGEHLAAVARTVEAKLRARGADPAPGDVLRALADRTLALWLDRPGKSNYLRDERHPLRLLCAELEGRIGEAEALVSAELSPRRAAPAKPKEPERVATWEEREAARRAAMEQIRRAPAGPLDTPIPRPTSSVRVDSAEPERLAEDAPPAAAGPELPQLVPHGAELDARPAPRRPQTAAEWAARFEAPADGPARAQDGHQDAPAHPGGERSPAPGRLDATPGPWRPLARGGRGWGAAPVFPARIRHFLGRPSAEVDGNELTEGEPPPE
ncbi:hypothetical protein [Polyangium mundeleinium]|uniref:Uncharacterized protein n=1 Tax=Polyangium mundeleinium TaxID=2995306 RepID=A0ABT5F969_9BACT|nr:hypothetical protein [Polyangium mundeleinium]MDC0750052.1 hypothetical protein [Polyangium mundeleinium]